MAGAEPPKVPIGVTLCNPLNIRQTEDHWVGQDASWGGPYCKFVAAEYGYRAGAIILRGYEARGINTVAAAITKWSPPSENPTSDYIRHMCGWLGVGADDPVALASLDFLRAMTRQELGSAYYADSVILTGIALSQPHGQGNEHGP
jgi:hypothetical protein